MTTRCRSLTVELAHYAPDAPILLIGAKCDVRADGGRSQVRLMSHSEPTNRVGVGVGDLGARACCMRWEAINERLSPVT